MAAEKDKFQAALDKIVKHFADGGMHRMVTACGLSEISFFFWLIFQSLYTQSNSLQRRAKANNAQITRKKKSI